MYIRLTFCVCILCWQENVQLGLVSANGQLHCSHMITLSNENDKERHLSRLPDLLYVESSVNVNIGVLLDEPKVCVLM